MFVQPVFDVLSDPEQVRQWWPDEAHYDRSPGGSGTISFGTGADAKVEQFTVVDAEPPRRFSFRWTHPEGRPALAANSMLVTFDLIPSGTGTRLRLTETGFRERGWDAAVLEATFREHETGWDYFLPRLARYGATLVQR